MALGELLADLLIGETTYKRVPSVKQMIRNAYRRSGGTWKATARELGVAESTLRSWRAGKSPSYVKLNQLREQAAEIRRRVVRKPVPDVKLASVKWVFDGRERVTPLSSLKMDKTTLREVQGHLIRGDSDQAAAVFLQGIRDPWYKAHFTAHEATERARRAAQAASGGGGGGEGDDYGDDIGMSQEEIAEYYDELSAGEIAGEEQDAIGENDDYSFEVGGFQ